MNILFIKSLGVSNARAAQMLKDDPFMFFASVDKE